MLYIYDENMMAINRQTTTMNEDSSAQTLERHEKLSVGKSDDVVRVEKHLVGSVVVDHVEPKNRLGVEKDLRKVAARTCYICPPREFEDVEQLLEHLVNEHAGKVDYKCQQCAGKELKTIQSYNAHLKLHDSRARQFKCSFCALRYSLKQSMQLHETNEHGAPSKHQPDQKKKHHTIQCEECGKDFSSSYIQQHKSLIHQQRTAVQCKICFKVFSYKAGLRDHVRAHTGEHPHKCDKCGRQFTTKFNLNQHFHNIHEKDSSRQGPEKCALCSISGLSIASLQGHIYEHHPSQDYPYTECPNCPKKFLTTNQMQNHKYYHNRTAKLLCTVCGKQQRTRSQLKLHMMNVHGKYVCILCTGHFKTDTDLETHLLHQVCLEE